MNAKIQAMTRLSAKYTSLAMVSLAVIASAEHSQASGARQERITADYRVLAWGQLVGDFDTRVAAYLDLRRELEKVLPPMALTDDPGQIRAAVRTLAKRIRTARAEAREGDIFTPAISCEFRRALLTVARANTCAAIMDDNPGGFSTHINDSYPEGKPFSTVPANVLSALPRLPKGIHYGFLGSDLFLLDERAAVILDRIRSAIPCASGLMNAS